MGKKGISHRKFSIEFKLSVLSDYFQSNQSEGRSWNRSLQTLPDAQGYLW